MRNAVVILFIILPSVLPISLIRGYINKRTIRIYNNAEKKPVLLSVKGITGFRCLAKNQSSIEIHAYICIEKRSKSMFFYGCF